MLFVLSLMQLNVAPAAVFIKHVFERVVVSAPRIMVPTRSITCSEIEHTVEYSSNIRANPGEGADVTILDDHHLAGWSTAPVHPRCGQSVGSGGVQRRPACRAVAARPAVAPLRYRGNGLAVSAARHPGRAQRSVSTPVTVALAGLTALITVWLGLLAQAGADRVSGPVAVPERLAVVQVQAGETLQRLAGRVAPDVPAEQVAERIRDLNELGSSAVEAGQTLIAPLG